MHSGPWLTYSDGEVQQFHPAVFESAQFALAKAGLDSAYEWIHHPPVGASLRPDFVLRRLSDGKWILVIEVKRAKEDVVSQRFQSQAKSYAETFQNNYPLLAAQYFAISNIEQTILFALNGTRPPVECQIQNGVFSSGDFVSQSKATQQPRFVDNLVDIQHIVTSSTAPQFDTVWPSILDDFVRFAQSLEGLPAFASSLAPPIASSSLDVAAYFGGGSIADAARVFIFRCLATEYLRGILSGAHHPQSGSLTVLRAASSANRTAALLAAAIDNLRAVDFDVVFDSGASGLYRSLSDPTVKQRLHNYIVRITTPPTKVFELARTRFDHRELLDALFSRIYPPEVQDETGKVQTDLELARVLAALAISNPDDLIIDPCCGEGSLLSAAYEQLESLGTPGIRAIKAVIGVEVDPLASYLASLRLVLKLASVLSPAENVDIRVGDMFASLAAIRRADVILMNPPFKRYEDQGSRPVPPDLRTYFDEAIERVDGVPAQTTGGQANLYNYFVEFVIKAAKDGARLGIVLDNKWFQHTYGEPLRGFLLAHCEIEAVVAYPRTNLFRDFTIATSLLIAKKRPRPSPIHQVRFVRSKVSPGAVDIRDLAAAFHHGSAWPSDWVAYAIPQSQLDSTNGWKKNFAPVLTSDYRMYLPKLPDLFEFSRRGGLNKEGGGISVFELPFDRTDYGPTRSRHPAGIGWQTLPGRELTPTENDRIRNIAAQVPANFRGWVLNNADDLSGYEVTPNDVSKQQTLEPPRLRGHPMFLSRRRTTWTPVHAAALQDMRNLAPLNNYISEIETVVGMTPAVLPVPNLWVGLREPAAGELIVPRKTRIGHRVHVNPFAFTPSGQQVRISSNFISYSNCTAIDTATNLNRDTAARLVAAFLMSSFGQLQFELEGLDREGLLAIEKRNFSRIAVFDPRWVRPASRQAILTAIVALPYPIRTDLPSSQQQQRNALDELFADEICARFPQLNKDALLSEVHSLLDVWTDARQQ